MDTSFDIRSRELELLIQDNMLKLANFDPESEEYSKILENVSKLVEMQQKVVVEKIELASKYGRDNEQRKFDNKKLIIDTALGAGGIVVPMLFYSKWTDKMLKFETDGTPTSSVFKAFIQKMTQLIFKK